MFFRFICTGACIFMLTTGFLFSQADQPQAVPEWLKETSYTAGFDGYYLWNFNRPLGRVNLLRAYDVLANSFTINQANLIFERPVNVEGRPRWGYRLDLMFGQATETLQGGPQNEARNDVYRHLFQAFGTYIAPAGKGLRIDFGKWGSSLGYEGNYTKDQINYSRSYFFNFLPFYHMGFRTSYPVSDKLAVSYMLVNGVQQTEDFNESKSQQAQLLFTPNTSSSWTLNYYSGREQRDLVPIFDPGIPTIPSQPGLSIVPVRPIPDGRLHTVDTYASINLNEKWMVVGEFDYVISRVEKNSAPQRIIGGAAYLKYQFTPKAHFGQRYERLNDKTGLFGGVSQNLNELTSTIAIRAIEGFETRLEYRRDFSNVPFFPTAEPGVLKKNQDTITVGLLWWFGGKKGAW